MLAGARDRIVMLAVIYGWTLMVAAASFHWFEQRFTLARRARQK
jgi:hypothetical protein